MKKAIVIGASSGIGKELALALSRSGYMVGITGRRGELLEEVRATAPENFVVAEFDAAAADATDRLRELIDRMGGVDLFILSAGTGHLNPELDTALEADTNRLNVDAFVAMTLFAYDYFLTRGGGHIAAITSVAGMRGEAAAPSYSASKAYQTNYLEGLRKRSAKRGENITVTELRPGSVATDMMKGEGHFWISTPERAAEVMLRAIKKRKAVQYVTPRWKTIGWMLKWMPRRIYDKI